MKLIQKHQTRIPVFQPPVGQEDSVRYFHIDSQHSGCSWHFHPEYQLSHVVSGRGQRITGDSLHSIEAGEVILLGPNLPHVWRYEEPSIDQPIESHVYHFRADFLGAEFFAKPEMRDLRLLLSRATQGLQLVGQSRELAAAGLVRMAEATGFERIIELLKVLEIFATSRETFVLSSKIFQLEATQLDIERLRRVCDHIKVHYDAPLDRDAMADLAHMSPSAFSRFFKTHTGMSFQDFLADVRIGNACQLLADPALSLLDVALRCGFCELSTFHRLFKRLRSMTPGDYRKQIWSLCR
jgi:AraC-like DNA-binding protein/quercetin dioxygenase-like cupin family protein